MLAYTIAIAVISFLISAYGIRFYAAPTCALFVKIIVATSWLFCVGMVLIVPTDVQVSAREVQPKQQHIALSLLWNITYWMCFLFTWVFNPIIASFVSSADFTVTARMTASIKENVLVYVLSTVVTVLGILLLIFSGKLTWEGIPGVISAAGNVFGLLVVVLLLAYGLVDVPRSIWRFSDLDSWSLYATRKVGKLHKKVEEAVSELKIAAALAMNMSKLISKRDSLRKYVDQINEEITSVIPLSAVQDVEIGDLDLDYELDHEGMVSLRKRCQRAVIVYHRSKYQYTKLVTSVQMTRERLSQLQQSGAHSQLLAREMGLKALAILCSLMSWCIILAEGTLSLRFPYADDLSMVSLLVRVCNENIVGTYVSVLVFLLYFCSCTYHSLFKMKIFSYYYLVPEYTDSYSLLLNASMLARFTAPLCYNFITLTKLKHTALTDSALAPMGQVPFFGRDFNVYYPIMGCFFYFAVAFNLWGTVIKAFRWVTFSSSLNFEDDDDDNDNDESDFLTRGQGVVYGNDTHLLDFGSVGAGSHHSGKGDTTKGGHGRPRSYDDDRELDTDARWKQAQERMAKRGTTTSSSSSRASEKKSTTASLDPNATSSDKLDSIFKGLLS
ncbi:LMBR1-like membrane protein [Chloropicon primus]|uniref:LMBR1-like membrane protein n=1 Tax=Chloropicon primus TaxID=1764295 RepID=A0A5B8MMN8_9CHLO|nr:LMBR1-like membrane protein [Chloropicon primus]UPR00985.1 LMBR1-like membrane protein [Chloropicon primus]|eukprot:QDZ21763.1 LMBR1-like membrane protein [Chloropicon primus]